MTRKQKQHKQHIRTRKLRRQQRQRDSALWNAVPANEFPLLLPRSYVDLKLEALDGLSQRIDQDILNLQRRLERL
jgi:hypothetical protein